jgi:hypothetical protein
VSGEIIGMDALSDALELVFSVILSQEVRPAWRWVAICGVVFMLAWCGIDHPEKIPGVHDLLVLIGACP